MNRIIAYFRGWSRGRWIALVCGGTFAVLLVDRVRHLYLIKMESLERGFIIADIALYIDMLANTNLLAGRFLPSVFFERYFNYPNFLCEHYSPTLGLVVPVFQMFPTAGLLLGLQVLCFGVTAALFYHLVHRVHGSAITALGLGVLYISNENVLFSFVSMKSGFYHDSLIPPLGMLVLYLAVRRKPYLFVVAAVLLAGVKENIPLFMMACAIVIFVFHHSRRRYALMMAAVSVAFIVANALLPITHDCVPRHSSAAFARLSANLSTEFVLGFPVFVFEFFRDNPFFLLALGAPLIAICSSGQFLLSYGLEMKFTGNQFLALGTMLLVAIVLSGLVFRGRRMRYVRIAIMVVSIVFAYGEQQGGREWMINLVNSTGFMAGRIDHAGFDALMARIPENATFSTTSPLQVHVAQRRGLWSGDERARFHLIDAAYLPLEEDQEFARQIERWQADDRLRVVQSQGTMTLYELTDPAPRN